METLKFGSKGESVKLLLRALNLKDDGIFGKDTENAVKVFQILNGIKADGIVGENTYKLLFNKTLDNSKITFDPINVHITKLPNRKIKYIVIHYTAGGSSAEGAAKKNRNVFINREASADFCVDDETIIQVNPDPSNYYCWAVGDGKGKKGIFNKDCISIEMCSYLDKETSSSQPNHSGWHISDKVLDKTIWLTKYLMLKYNIPVDRVIRHYDATGKSCPGIIGWNDNTLYDTLGKATKLKNNSSEWIKFKSKL